LALPIPTYGSGYTLAFLHGAAAAEIAALMPLEKGLCPVTSSLVLAAWPHGCKVWCREGTANTGGLWAAGLASAIA